MTDYRTVPVERLTEWASRIDADTLVTVTDDVSLVSQEMRALSASPVPDGDLVERAAKKAAHAAHRFKGGRWGEDTMWKAMGERERESHLEATRALVAAMQPGWRDKPHCQSCGGEVQGWTCQGCGLMFRENEFGRLVAEPLPAAPEVGG